MTSKTISQGYSVGTFAKMVGCCRSTLQRWDKTGQLVAFRTPGGHRFYTQEQLREIKGLLPESQVVRKTLVYCRVSSGGQKADLQRQVAAMEQFCIARGTVVTAVMTDIGSGLNYNRKNFLVLTDAIARGEVAEVIVAHKDRLVRFGFEWIEHLCEIHHTKLTVINATTMSPEQEMTQDLLSIVHCFSSRLYGLRKYSKQLQQALETVEPDA